MVSRPEQTPAEELATEMAALDSRVQAFGAHALLGKLLARYRDLARKQAEVSEASTASFAAIDFLADDTADQVRAHMRQHGFSLGFGMPFKRMLAALRSLEKAMGKETAIRAVASATDAATLTTELIEIYRPDTRYALVKGADLGRKIADELEGLPEPSGLSPNTWGSVKVRVIAALLDSTASERERRRKERSSFSAGPMGSGPDY